MTGGLHARETATEADATHPTGMLSCCSIYLPVADPGFSKWGALFVTNGGAHILFSGKKCMKLKEIGLKWGGARLLAPVIVNLQYFFE